MDDTQFLELQERVEQARLEALALVWRELDKIQSRLSTAALPQTQVDYYTDLNDRLLMDLQILQEPRDPHLMMPFWNSRNPSLYNYTTIFNHMRAMLLLREVDELNWTQFKYNADQRIPQVDFVPIQDLLRQTEPGYWHPDNLIGAVRNPGILDEEFSRAAQETVRDHRAKRTLQELYLNRQDQDIPLERVQLINRYPKYPLFRKLQGARDDSTRFFEHQRVFEFTDSDSEPSTDDEND